MAWKTTVRMRGGRAEMDGVEGAEKSVGKEALNLKDEGGERRGSNQEDG